jgi:hypothetical protein
LLRPRRLEHNNLPARLLCFLSLQTWQAVNRPDRARLATHTIALSYLIFHYTSHDDCS